MARTPNRFIDPAGVLADYLWAINHLEEEETGKERPIDNTSNTANVGLVKQQGGTTPYTLRFSGTILQHAQLQAFWQWFELCETQTIYFRDFDGQEYEAQITSFKPKRVRVGRNPREPSLLAKWEYTMEMQIYAFRAGDMVTAGVSP